MSAAASFIEADPFVVVDLFAGGGGASTGAAQALAARGLTMELAAVNHWPIAIQTHSANHPNAAHYVANIKSRWPRSVVPGGHVDLLIAGIECIHHSRAAGGKPRNPQSRAQANWLLGWLRNLDVDCLLIENVQEFRSWGDLDDKGRPVNKLRGGLFVEWLGKLQRLGYRYEYKILNCANYGDATTRERFFLVARKDRRPIVWPEPTHRKPGKASEGQRFDPLPPWRSAAECIDWADLGPSIFERPVPLVENTRCRLGRGMQLYAGALAPLYIRLLDLPEDVEAKLLSRCADGPLRAFVTGSRGNSVPVSPDDPAPTITAIPGIYMAMPTIERFVMANRQNNVPTGLDQPISAATSATGGGMYLITADAQPVVLGQQSGAGPRPVSSPGPTIAAAGVVRMATPIVVPYYGTGVAASIEQPLHSITATDRFAAAVPIAERFIVPYHSEKPGETPRLHDISAPLPTQTTENRFAIVATMLIPKFGENGAQLPRVHDVGDPTPTITSEGAGRLVSATLTQAIESALETIAPRRLVVIDDGSGPSLYVLDIRFRMLKPSELAKATGFPDDYIFHGNKTDIVRQIGNAIPVNTAAALVGAIVDVATEPERRSA